MLMGKAKFLSVEHPCGNICSFFSWHVSEEIACSIEEPAGKSCKNLTLNQGLRCLYPLCPEPNDASDFQLSDLDHEFKFETEDGYLPLETGQKIIVTCKNECWWFFMLCAYHF